MEKYSWILDFITGIRPGQWSMILGVLLIALGISNAFSALGIEVTEGKESLAIGLGAFFVVVGLVMSWYRAAKEAENAKPPPPPCPPPED